MDSTASNRGLSRRAFARRLFSTALATSFGGAIPLLWPEDAEAAKAKPQPSFFNTVEVRSKNLKPFKKWRAALGRYAKESKSKKKLTCPPGSLDICSYDDWTKFLTSVKGKKPLVQLNEVNARINKASYVQDNVNWGRKDYWATPAEFMSRFGDCEDYAILKYLSLRKLGWKEKQLRVVAVKDLNLKVGHAVLVVLFKHPKTGKTMPLLLDNQIKKIVLANKVRHYQPVFSLNKYFWWKHTPATS